MLQIKNKENKMELNKYSPIVLRFAVSFVFLWFGVNQLVNPESFLGYVPDWLYPHPTQMAHEHPFQLLHNLPLTAHVIIMGNGLFETVFGTLLVLGIFARISALLLSIHLAGIAFSLGYNDIAIRDIGLSLATFAVFLNGNDKLCLGNRFGKLSKK